MHQYLAMLPILAIGLGQCQGEFPEDIPKPRNTGFSVFPDSNPSPAPSPTGEQIDFGMHRVDVRVRWGKPAHHNANQDFYPVGNGAYTVINYDPNTQRIVSFDYKGMF